MVTWRDAVRVELARYRTQTGNSVITLDEFDGEIIEHLQTQFPENNTPKDKVRQILQQLKKRNEVEFIDDAGRYRIKSLDLSGISPYRIRPYRIGRRPRRFEGVPRTSPSNSRTVRTPLSASVESSKRFHGTEN